MLNHSPGVLSLYGQETDDGWLSAVQEGLEGHAGHQRRTHRIGQTHGWSKHATLIRIRSRIVYWSDCTLLLSTDPFALYNPPINTCMEIWLRFLTRLLIQLRSHPFIDQIALSLLSNLFLYIRVLQRLHELHGLHGVAVFRVRERRRGHESGPGTT